MNILSRLVITFLPRSKRLLISWLQSPSAVILEPKKIKPDTVSTVSPSISHEVIGPDAMIFVSACGISLDQEWNLSPPSARWILKSLDHGEVPHLTLFYRGVSSWGKQSPPS